MKRSPLKPSTKPLKRTRLKPKRPRPRRSERVRDEAYLDRVRALPCILSYLGDCLGPIESDHMGRRAFGRKCSDYETAPLCSLHHRQRTDLNGAFKGWTKAQSRKWLDSAIDTTQHILGFKEAA